LFYVVSILSSQICYSFVDSASPSCNIYVPKISNLLSEKMRALQPLVLKRFDDISTSYDLEVDQYCQSMQRSHQAILQKQFRLAQTFGNMMDEQLSAEEDACNPLNEGIEGGVDGTATTANASAKAEQEPVSTPQPGSLYWTQPSFIP